MGGRAITSCAGALLYVAGHASALPLVAAPLTDAPMTKGPRSHSNVAVTLAVHWQHPAYPIEGFNYRTHTVFLVVASPTRLAAMELKP